MLANCTKRVIEKVFVEEEAERIEKILDLVDRGRISGKNGEQLIYFAVRQTTNEDFEKKIKESLEPRKKRQMSEQTKQKRYAEKLAELKKKYGITE